MSQLGAGEVKVSTEQYTNGRLHFMVKQLEDRNSIINGISDALIVLDPKTYQILDVNESFLRIYGLNEDQVLGKKCYEITHQLLIRAKICRHFYNKVYKHSGCLKNDFTLFGSL